MNPFAALGRYAIRAIDWIIRFAYQVKPYSEDPDCILRISRSRSKQRIRLSDGVQVQLGDPILAIHCWNERLGGSPQDRIALGWGRYLLLRVDTSLRMLAAYLDQHPWANDIVALHAELGIIMNLQAAMSIARHHGIDAIPKERPGVRFWRRAFWDNLYSHILMWTYNPGSLRGKHLSKMVRVKLWISRERLAQIYGEGHTQ